jgi:LuxR family transcriptional regulator of csgAB operon
MIHRAQKEDPDIVFLCSHFLIKNWKNVIANIKNKVKRSRIVIFNCHFTQHQELMLAKEGVVGILGCNSTLSTLIKALKKVHEGELWLRRDLIPHLINSHPGTRDEEAPQKDDLNITRREFEILSLIGNGYKNHQISSELCISESTVKTHIQNIFKKLNINNRIQAIFYVKNNLHHGK